MVPLGSNETGCNMRNDSAFAGLVALALILLPVAALALQPSTPMSGWKKASPADKTDLLDRLVKSRDATKASVRKCLDETSSAPGHGDLPIEEIAAACIKMGDAGQPV